MSSQPQMLVDGQFLLLLGTLTLPTRARKKKERNWQSIFDDLNENK
jgi:hypothetical protein